MPGELAGQNRGFHSSPQSIFIGNFPQAFRIPVWWVQIPVLHKPRAMAHAYNPGTPRQKALKFKVTLGHMSLKPACNTWDPVSKQLKVTTNLLSIFNNMELKFQFKSPCHAPHLPVIQWDFSLKAEASNCWVPYNLVKKPTITFFYSCAVIYICASTLLHNTDGHCIGYFCICYNVSD